MLFSVTASYIPVKKTKVTISLKGKEIKFNHNRNCEENNTKY